MSEARVTLLEAIARQRLVSARYNDIKLQLAPHLIFQRHGSLFLSALNLGKGWRSDEEPRLGQYKLDGLSEVTLLEDGFDPLPSFDRVPPRGGDQVLLTV